ncbi:hypothetical protein, partial [Skermanella aerolata]
YRSQDLLWKLAIFVTFILAALALVWIDRIGVVYRDATGRSRIGHDAHGPTTKPPRHSHDAEPP